MNKLDQKVINLVDTFFKDYKTNEEQLYNFGKLYILLQDELKKLHKLEKNTIEWEHQKEHINLHKKVLLEIDNRMHKLQKKGK